MPFLQAQIKPHFLYNTLNTIVSFCYTDPDRAGELILELSNYLRSSFDFTNMDKFVPIEKEIEFEDCTIITKKSHVNSALCKGCGTCGAQCPNSAIIIKHFGFEQINAMIRALLIKT